MTAIDRRTAILGTIGTALLADAVAAQTPPPIASQSAVPLALSQPDETIDLWPNGAPGMPATPPVEVTTERGKLPSFNDRVVAGVSKPRLAVFRPDKPNGAALVAFPGGGYARMAIDKEGYEIGRYLAARGFTVFVLFYRLPGEGWAAGPDVALQDAQRSMRLIRSRAKDFGIDPTRVAAMGFSAGGHLCADLVARFDAKTYDPVDAADALSARPMIAAPIYPVVSMSLPVAHAGSRELLLGKNPTRELEEAHSPHLHIRSDSPPCFLCAAEDDKTVPTENILLLHAALRAARIPVEMHLFGEGSHGFGLRGVVGKPAAVWPELFLAWARTQGFY